MTRANYLVAIFVVAIAAIASAEASTNYTSIEATSAKPVRISYHASAHKTNCTPAPLPTIRVKQSPKWGILTVRKGILTSDKITGCQPMKIPAQVVFYQARAGYAGPDHLTYEVISENGEAVTYDVSITVKEEAPAPGNRSDSARPL